MKIKYRMECYNLRLSKIKLQDGAMVAPRVQMGFDTGSAFTFLPRRIFRKILNFVSSVLCLTICNFSFGVADFVVSRFPTTYIHVW